MTYARRQTRPKPRKSQSFKFPAPVAGWVANRNLSEPGSVEGPGAAVLDNFFPKSSSVKLRRGKQLYCTLGDGSSPCLSLFSYMNGDNQKLFAATADKIYHITSVTFPYSWDMITDEEALIVTENGDWFGVQGTEGLDIAQGFTSGKWSVVQFATSGDVYLIGVNGSDTGFIFDGDDFFPLVKGGVSSQHIDGVTDAFQDGEIVTGGTSGATAKVSRVIAGGGGTATLQLIDISGPFTDNEPLTGSLGGEGQIDGAATLIVPGPDFGTYTSADMSYVWAYKNRLFFVRKNSMTAHYMQDVDAVGGATDFFPLAGVFGRGGSLLFGSAWSLDGTADAGLSEQCIFVSSEGEVAVYQGGNPSEANDWAKVGTYRIGKPLGPRAHFRGGGDIAIATSVGLVPLSKAVNLDVTSLAVATVSYRIADAWSDATTLRGMSEWQCEIWSEQKMAIIAPPKLEGGADPVMFVSNTETGAWARFTGWQASAMEAFQGVLYFGGDDGKVFIANTSGTDAGEVFTGKVVPLFTDLGSPSSAKIGTVGRAVTRANGATQGKLTLQSDYDEDTGAAPNATILTSENSWGTGVWGQSVWGATTPQKINQEWESVGGMGYALSLGYQVSSGSIMPLDDEIVRLELLYNTAELVT
ncbi:hypothetical protein [Sphingobium sp. DC-2]|uniref:hypothetical protein n=1 Tax=Sphingobium sp. DC-2 TaxID=1303256 RepID=UPI0004C3B002|nr:hypothetical protein [Sphingobium sp. DC-2]